jgi:acetylornithine deacetylase/succinyl-diaminopimelate desuccinylase-like protein
VIEDGKLYGRGGADDGYAIYSAITALLALQEQQISHSRVIVLIEASEESGSPDLPFYMEQLNDKLENTSLVICLDSGCGDYERLWLTTSLRGLVGGELRVNVLTEGVHSGDASGVVPSSMRIIRELLDRVENPKTGEVLVTELNDEIPSDRQDQAAVAVAALGDTVYQKFPFVEGMEPAHSDLTELVLNRTWRPALSVTGMDGAPPSAVAGSVQRPFTSVKLSMRLPPSVDSALAEKALGEVLTKNPPYNAQVSFTPDPSGTGWNSTSFSPWFKAAAEKVLGPNSNAHGPNEFLHIPTGKRVTETVCYILEAHAKSCK